MPIELVCSVCKSVFIVSPSRAHAKTCSQKCYHDSTKGKTPHNKGKGKGYKLIPKGYVLVKDPLHHRANSCGYVREHILVMEAILEWPVEWPASVHHKDGNRANNDPENLEYYEHHSTHLKEHFPKGAPVHNRWTNYRKEANYS